MPNTRPGMGSNVTRNTVLINIIQGP